MLYELYKERATSRLWLRVLGRSAREHRSTKSKHLYRTVTASALCMQRKSVARVAASHTHATAKLKTCNNTWAEQTGVPCTTWLGMHHACLHQHTTPWTSKLKSFLQVIGAAPEGEAIVVSELPHSQRYNAAQVLFMTSLQPKTRACAVSTRAT